MALAMKDPSRQFIESCVEALKVPIVSKTYNITGRSAAYVIAIFKSIVNNSEGSYKFSKRKEFTFNIGKTPAMISFKLKANPTDDQPGNGVFRVHENKKKRKCRKYNQKLVDELKNRYPNTKEFAQDIKRFFKDNSELPKSGNKIIQEVYILLLFEIGRRLVKDDEKHTNEKKALDSLPISQAITTIVKLFEQEECRFEDVFLTGGTFHCFTKSLRKRKKAIEQLECKNITALFCREEDQESSEDSSSESKGSSQSYEEEDTSSKSEEDKDTSSESDEEEDTSSESDEEEDTSRESEELFWEDVTSKTEELSINSVSKSEGLPSEDAEAKSKNLQERMSKFRKYKLVKASRAVDRNLSDTDRQ